MISFNWSFTSKVSSHLLLEYDEAIESDDDDEEEMNQAFFIKRI